MKRSAKFFLIGAIVFQSGCAGLSLQQVPVLFDDPASRLEIRPVPPNEKEAAGVILRQKMTDGSELNYEAENRIYARVENGKGIQLDLKMKRMERYHSTEETGVFRMTAATEIDQEGGHLYEEILTDARGSIRRFVNGSHESKIGKFQITAWTREPELPLEAVKVGSLWNYLESMNLKMDSFWIRQTEPMIQEMKSECVLEGFALVHGIRTVVIRKTNRQTQKQHFKVLFKDVQFQITTESEERDYWDYERGRLAASVLRTRSWTEGINFPVNDYGESQTLLELKEVKSPGSS